MADILSKRWIPWIWAAAALLAVFLAGARIWTDILDASPGSASASDLRAEITEAGVRVRALLDTDRTEKGGSQTLWITIENRGDAEILGPRITAIDAPGFDTAGACWQGTCPGPGCVPACPLGRLSPEATSDCRSLWG